jgi:hypothetical protein
MRGQRRIWVFNPKPRSPIPQQVREELADRLLRYAEKRWRGRVRKLLLRFRGPYAYVAATQAERGGRAPITVCRYSEKGEVPTELCRLGFLGGMERWEYAFYSYSHERYERSVCASGSFVATPEEALDSSAVYVQ